MSQFDLELSIDAASGSISRMESGKVNPTKETLKQIAKEISLSREELSDLMEIRPMVPTVEEIELAQQEVKEYFNTPERFAYLLDEWGHVYSLSIGFQSLMQLNQKAKQTYIGKHIYEIILKPEYGVHNFFNIQKATPLLMRELARGSSQVDDFEATTTFRELCKIPLFDKLWSMSNQVNSQDLFKPEHKIVEFTLGDKAVSLIYSREPLKSNSRFEVIEFTPLS